MTRAATKHVSTTFFYRFTHMKQNVRIHSPNKGTYLEYQLSNTKKAVQICVGSFNICVVGVLAALRHFQLSCLVLAQSSPILHHSLHTFFGLHKDTFHSHTKYPFPTSFLQFPNPYCNTTNIQLLLTIKAKRLSNN